MAWLLYLFITATQPQSLAWQQEHVALVDVLGMDSPTALLFTDGRLLAGGDLAEAFAGVYVLVRKKEGFQAQLLKYLPQMDLEDLSFEKATRNLGVISARRFSDKPHDWVGQFMAFEPRQLRVVESLSIELSPLCFDQSMRCGMVAAFPLDETTWIAVKKKDPSTLYIFDRTDEAWNMRTSSPLTYKRRFVTISAVRQHGAQLLFMVRNQWLIGSLPIKQLQGEIPGELRLEEVFNFAYLKQELRTKNRRLGTEGMAESFDIDSQGNLYVLLNNRSEPFLGVSGKIPKPTPKVVIYAPAKN